MICLQTTFCPSSLQHGGELAPLTSGAAPHISFWVRHRMIKKQENWNFHIPWEKSDFYLFILPYKTFGETGMFFCFGCYIYLLVFDNGDMGMHPWLKEAHPSSRWISIFHICSLNSMVFTTMLVSMQIWSIFFFLIWVNSRKTTVLLAIVPNL